MTKVELATKINSALLDLTNDIGERFPAGSDKLVPCAEVHKIGEEITTVAEKIEEMLSDFAKEP